MAAAPDPCIDYVVYTLDSRGHVTSWNEHAESWYGYRAEEVIGQHVAMLYGQDRAGRDACAEALSNAERSGRYEAEVRRRHKNGTHFEARILIQPLRGAASLLLGFTEMLSSPDSASRHTELRTEGLAEAYRKFEHEYNNVLFSIMGGLELLRRRMPADDSAGNELFDLVRRHLDKAKSLLPPLSAVMEPNGQASKPTADRGDGPVVAPSATAMAGLRVLVVEDESLVRMLIEDYLNQLDCKMVGFASTVEKGLALAAHSDIDIALLDWNLQGRPVEPVAQELSRRGVPFVFISGSLAASWNSRPTIRKPFDVDTLRREMARAISGAERAP